MSWEKEERSDMLLPVLTLRWRGTGGRGLSGFGEGSGAGTHFEDDSALASLSLSLSAGSGPGFASGFFGGGCCTFDTPKALNQALRLGVALPGLQPFFSLRKTRFFVKYRV